MKIKSILSLRASNDMVYSDLIYEWEDDYSEKLNVPIVSHCKFIKRLQNALFIIANKTHLDTGLQRIDRLISRNKHKVLVFTLYPKTFFSSFSSSNKIPFIIDFDYGVDLKTFYKVYQNCDIVIISSRVAYEYLKNNNCPLNIKHVPLSIKSNLKVQRIDMKDREYDIFIARQNPVLMEYLKRYEQKHPDIHYIIRKWDNGALYSGNAYYSNKKGRLGEFSDRNAYFGLLANSKVAFYSTTGSDTPNTRFMNHVTPALLEYLTAGCYIMIRWYDTPDSEFFNLSHYFENVKTYESFERLLDRFLSAANNPYDICDDFLRKYGFSNQFKIFQQVIKDHEQ